MGKGRIGERVMVNILDKLKEYLKVNDGGEGTDIDDDGTVEVYEPEDTEAVIEQEEDEEPVRPRVASRNPRVNKVIPIRKDLEVTMFKPSSVEESRLVVDSLKEGKTVVLNLEEVRTAVAQRIVDFICGATYHMEGNLQSISDSIFIVTPANVELSGEFVDLLGSTSSVDHRADASGYGMRL